MAEAHFDLDIVSELLYADAPGPAAAWLHRGQGSLAGIDVETALSAVEAARRLGLGARLNAARDETRDKLVRKAAGAAIQKLKAAGAKVETPAQQKSWSLSAEVHAPQPPVGMIGMPDPNGYFPYALVTFHGNDAIVCVGTAGAGQGYDEENHAHLPRSEARSLVHRMRDEHSLTEVPFYVALSFVQQAFEEGGRRAPGWGHLIENIDTSTELSARVIDPLAEATIELDPVSLGNVGPLVRQARDIVYVPAEADMRELRAEAMAVAMSPLDGDVAAHRSRLHEVFDRYTDKLIGEATTRSTWSLALDVVTWLSAHRREVDMVAPARASALALRSGMAGRDIPFFRQSVEHAFYSFMVEAMQKGAEERPAHGPAL